MRLSLNENIVTKVLSKPTFHKGCEGGEVRYWWEVDVEYYSNKEKASATLIFYTEEGANQVKMGYIFYH